MARNRTPVVIGTGTPLISKVASASVNGLNGFEIGTLMPERLNGKSVPGILNGSVVKGVAASAESKYERVYLKSANNTRYLSHRSRIDEPYTLWRSADGIAGVKAAKL